MRGAGGRLLLTSAVFIVFALFIGSYQFQRDVPLKESFDTFPFEWKGWEGLDRPFTEEILENLGVTEYLSRDYRKGNEMVSLYVGYYSSQREGEQIHSPKHCLPGGGWFKLSERIRRVPVEGAGEVDLIEASYKKGNYHVVMLYWYHVKDRYVTNDYALKLSMIYNSLVHRRNDAAFVKFSVYYPEGGEMKEAVDRIEGFMGEFVPLLGDFMPE